MTGLASGIAAKAIVPAALKAVPWRLVFDLGIAIAFLALLAWAIRVNDLRDKWNTQATHCATARLSDRNSYEQAQRDAKITNQNQVSRIEQQSKKVSDNEKDAYLRDLAKLRADRVRQQSTPAAPGSAGPANPSPGGSNAPRIDEAGVCVPATSDVCEAGAEIELRLMHLQNLSEQQSQIDPNKN